MENLLHASITKFKHNVNTFAFRVEVVFFTNSPVGKHHYVQNETTITLRNVVNKQTDGGFSLKCLFLLENIFSRELNLFCGVQIYQMAVWTYKCLVRKSLYVIIHRGIPLLLFSHLRLDLFPTLNDKFSVDVSLS